MCEKLRVAEHDYINLIRKGRMIEQFSLILCIPLCGNLPKRAHFSLTQLFYFRFINIPN
jgi:hypothetical protein